MKESYCRDGGRGEKEGKREKEERERERKREREREKERDETCVVGCTVVALLGSCFTCDNVQSTTDKQTS